jgi:uncharacterized membrane protein
MVAALVLGAVLSTVRVSAHGPLRHLLFQGTEDDARTLLIGIVGAVITIIALVLGLTLVALQVSSTQYSPRVLRNFLRDRPNQVFISVMVATFAYSAGGLYSVVAAPAGQTASYPQLAVTVAIVLLFFSLVALIFFLDHLAHSIQIDRLMAGIQRATVNLINQEPPGLRPGSGPGKAAAPPVWAVAILAHTDGYVQTIHPERLLQIAEQLQVTIQIAPIVGEHVVASRPIAHAWRTSPEQTPPDPTALAGAVQSAVWIGYQRTLQQDTRFGMRQLVDIALRALSPAVNDPYTAVQAIHRLSVLFCALTPRPLGDYQINGSKNEARVIVRAPGFADYAELACSLIRRYGAAEPTVTTALLVMLQDAQALVTDPDRMQVLISEARLIVSDAEQATRQPADLGQVHVQADPLLSDGT